MRRPHEIQLRHASLAEVPESARPVVFIRVPRRYEGAAMHTGGREDDIRETVRKLTDERVHRRVQRTQ